MFGGQQHSCKDPVASTSTAAASTSSTHLNHLCVSAVFFVISSFFPPDPFHFEDCRPNTLHHLPPPSKPRKGVLKPSRLSHTPGYAALTYLAGMKAVKRVKWDLEEGQVELDVADQSGDAEGEEDEVDELGEEREEGEPAPPRRWGITPTPMPPSSFLPPRPSPPLPSAKSAFKRKASSSSSSSPYSYSSNSLPLPLSPPDSPPASPPSTSAAQLQRKRWHHHSPPRSSSPSPPPPVIVNGQEQYELEAVLQMEERTDGRLYEVKWVGYDEMTWEPREFVRETKPFSEFLKREREEEWGRGRKKKQKRVKGVALEFVLPV